MKLKRDKKVIVEPKPPIPTAVVDSYNRMAEFRLFMRRKAEELNMTEAEFILCALDSVREGISLVVEQERKTQE